MELEKEFTFRSSNLPQCCFKIFAAMRNENKFCDIELSVGTQRISAHRVILAATIPLFRETFSNEEEIPIRNIDPNVFECLIHYAYSCELKITMDNVRGLLSGSCAMGMKEVQDACCDFLLQQLHPQNVLSFKDLANDLNLPKLNEYVDLYVQENFDEVCRTPEFLNSPFTYVRDLISMDELNVDSEEKVMDFVLRWVKASVDERKGNIPELLGQVRMVLLEPVYLTELVEREELIRKSYVTRDLVDEAKNYNLFPERRRKICSFATEPRRFMNISEETPVTDTTLYYLERRLKYTVGQLDLTNQTCHTKFTKEYFENNGPVGTLNRKMYFFHDGYSFEYDPESNRCQLLNPFTVWRKCTSAVSLRNRFFVCGGYTSGFVASNGVECFDPGKNEWTQVNCLQTARWRLNSVSLGDHIYALGGRDTDNVYDIVEKYSFILGKWQFMSAMLTPRSSGGAAVLNGKIYICGGNTSRFGNQCMATSEVYDPITNKWNFVSPMNTARKGLNLLAFSGKLYVIGGYDGDSKVLNSCEVFDLQSDKWEYGPTADGSFHVSGVVVV